MKIKELSNYLESIAPLSYQESYDNSGLIVGNFDDTITGVLVSLDCTEEVITEAIARGCNVVVAHHPVVFKGLKKLNGKNYVERAVLKAIKNDIALYAIHTNLDNVAGGVNFKIAEKLGLQQVKVLSPKRELLSKMTVFVPKEHTQVVLEAIFEAGAGQIGNYDQCSFRSEGTGTFRPNEDANPYIGQVSVQEQVNEDRIEVVFPTFVERKIVSAMLRVHPYEVPAYYLHKLENDNPDVGSGAVGTLAEALDGPEFLSYLKQKMGLSVIRHTALPNQKIKRIAVCGGVGSFLLGDAKRAGADVFVTADYKYHEFFDAENQITICDIGHYESEVFTKDLLCDILSKKFTTFAVLKSDINTNPIGYFY
jgi:dinuclear metal center YbgI/SA1388 family protein